MQSEPLHTSERPERCAVKHHSRAPSPQPQVRPKRKISLEYVPPAQKTTASSDSEDEEANGPASSFPQLVDTLEFGLSKCLMQFRSEAESVLAKHLDGLETLQAQHDLELAAAVAENKKLRHLLGLKGSEEEVQQKVLFQAQGRALPSQSRNSASSLRQGQCSRFSFSSDDRKKQDEVKPRLTKWPSQASHAQPGTTLSGGSWQAFMAWVPNGASLQNPEPWKPLQQHQLQDAAHGASGPLSPRSLAKKNSLWNPNLLTRVRESAEDPARANGKMNANRAVLKMADAFMNVLPGRVSPHVADGPPEEHEHKHEKNEHAHKSDEDDDSDAGSADQSDASSADWHEVSACWRPTARETKKLNSGMKAESRDANQHLMRRRRGSDALSLFSDTHAQDSLHNLYRTRNRKWFIILPNSTFRTAWVFIGVILVVYDALVVPMSAFPLPSSVFLTFMDWVSRLFWTFDMGVSCTTAVVLPDGTIEYDIKVILRHYARSWLFLDSIVVGSTWLGLIELTGDMDVVSIVRIIRVLRLLRLLRVADFVSYFDHLIGSDKMRLAAQLSQYLVFVICILHYAACGWWGIGSHTANDRANGDQSVGLQYLISVNWAMSSFTGGVQDLPPSSPLEHLYSVFFGILAFMLGIGMVSHFTATLTQMDIIDGNGARQMATLKLYLRQNNVTSNLTMRLCRNASHAISGELNTDSVELLAAISEPLKIEMYFEMYSPILLWHPLFQMLNSSSAGRQLIRRVSHQAMSTLLLANGDIIFEDGETTIEPKMYLVVSGSLQYCPGQGDLCWLGEKEWIAEPVLWTNWKHRGNLMATSDVKMAMLDAKIFQDLSSILRTKRAPLSLALLRYAALFVQAMNAGSNTHDVGDFVEDVDQCSTFLRGDQGE